MLGVKNGAYAEKKSRNLVQKEIGGRSEIGGACTGRMGTRKVCKGKKDDKYLWEEGFGGKVAIRNLGILGDVPNAEKRRGGLTYRSNFGWERRGE